MPTFGDTTSGGDEFPCSGDRALMDRFAISENGTADSISVFFGASSGSGANAKGLIYTDSAGAPGTLVAASVAGAVGAGGGWVTMNLAGESLSTGNYWLGAVTSDFQPYFGEDASGSAPDVVMANGTLSYATPPGTWPGTDASYTTGLNVYVTYSTGGGATRFMGTPSAVLVATSRASIF